MKCYILEAPCIVSGCYTRTKQLSTNFRKLPLPVDCRPQFITTSCK